MSHAGVFDAIAPATLARVSHRIPLDLDALAVVCRRWQVRELSLFGSALRDDFGPTSDVDVLVEFLPGAPWSLPDFVALQDQLANRFGRLVDLVERARIANQRHVLAHEYGRVEHARIWRIATDLAPAPVVALEQFAAPPPPPSDRDLP